LAVCRLIQHPPDKFYTAILFGVSFMALEIFGLLAAILQHWRILEGITKNPLTFPAVKPLVMIKAMLLRFIGLLAFIPVLLFQRLLVGRQE
jgi:hypothetical protein